MNSHIEKYLSFYLDLVPTFTNIELEFIKPHLEFKTLEKGEYYLKRGQIQKKLSFVVKGLLRQYYIDLKGKEITVNFTNENNFSTDYNAFIQQSPSNYNIKCLEQTTIIELDYKRIQEGYLTYKNYERFGRLIAEKILIQRQKRIESLLFDSAEIRYINFINKHSNLFNRISLSHLSTYLGVERQSLSRIRKNISE
jgi:CRP-like cAMP-binding protein